MLEAILSQQPIFGRALFVDMNSFFASVEQQIKPYLRNRPVGVCPFINDHTCIIAASIEAKLYGIKTGTKVSEAKRLCPEIILISDDPSIYRKYHTRIMSELNETSCKLRIKSIDEAYLEVPNYLIGQSRIIAVDIKKRLRNIGSQLGSSIGISSNMWLAKMASNARKPDGLVEINLDELEGFYSLLKITDLTGISWRLAKKLQSINIMTPLDFFNAPYGLLKRTFGQPGEAWYLRLRGYEVDQKSTNRSQIGHQVTIVPEPARTFEEVLSHASQLSYKAASRLRAAKMMARSIVVRVRFVDHTNWSNIYRGRYPFADSGTLYHHTESLLIQLAAMPKAVRLVSVTATDLCGATEVTQSLWRNNNNEEKLSEALDSIAERYGRTIIKPARQLLTPQMHDRIGFGNAAHVVRELTNEDKKVTLR